MAAVMRRALQQRLSEAAKLHDRGDLVEASRHYERILREVPQAWEPAFLLALVRFQKGQFEVAEQLLRRVVRLNDRHAQAWFYLGEALAGIGRNDEAEQAYRRAISEPAGHAMAGFKLGLIAESRSDWKAAEAAYRQALKVRPEFPEALNNLANRLRASAREDEAEACLRRAVELRPDFAPAYANLGALLTGRELLPAALEVLDAGIRNCAASGGLHFHRGVALAARGERQAALADYGRALELEPGHAEAYNNVGVLFLEEGLYADARACFERALAYRPDLAEAHNNLGNLLMQLEQHGQARAAFERAIGQRPSFASPFNGLGMSLAELGECGLAIEAFRKALERQPAFAEAEANLGAALRRIGRVEEARACYRSAAARNGSVALRIKAALACDPIPQSRDGLLATRARIESELDELLAAHLRTDEADLLKYPETGFYLAYHGMNDRAILEKLARVYAQACPSLVYRAASAPRRVGTALRIGFVSRFLYSHSVGNFFNPIIRDLSTRAGIEVYLFTIGHKRDATLDSVTAHCREHVVLPLRSLQTARRALEARRLDLLVYADIGMDPFSYLLSFARLAPLQCVLHGHSDTSGVPALDYFISSRLIEPPNAQQQYSERLVLLDELPMVLPVYPELVHRPSRRELNLPQDVRLYLCPMKLHKIHPDMDELVAGILSRDPEGRVLFFDDNSNAGWGEALWRRLRHGPASAHLERILLLPFVSDMSLFRAILSHADVVLDTPHHGGGTTCNICFSVGAPMVSLVGDTCRGRGPSSFYSIMGIADGITTTADDYVEAATGIAGDPQRRRGLSEAIVGAADRLHRTRQVQDAYSDLFQRMATGEPLPLAEEGP